MQFAAQAIRRNTTPGRDKIDFKILKNLNNEDYERLTKIYNSIWESSSLPPEWKHAEIILIPKPGKPPGIENMRPISLTSCMGKLLEHIILNRLQPHLESVNALADTMFGFRRHLSTQDVLLQIKEEILDRKSSQAKAILALDLAGAFDNVRHEAILENLSHTNCGARIYNYVKDFLRDRTATIGVGTLRTPEFRMPNRGTPQGSVLSPTLFNIAMRKLPEALSQIAGIRYALYADDITIWTPAGSLGEQENALQSAIDTVQNYVQPRGLQCSAEKSELILIKERRGQKRPDPPLYLHLRGQTIPQVKSLRILGMHLQEGGGAGDNVSKVLRSLAQVERMATRIINKRRGLKEIDGVRLVNALVISRIVYALPYHKLNQEQTKKIDTAIRKAFKHVLGLPVSTSNAKLASLGLHNTYAELAEAQLLNQLERLTKSPTGRNLLAKLGYDCFLRGSEDIEILNDQIRSKITVRPIPRHMQPGRHDGRRQARIRFLEQQIQSWDNTLYTDASRRSSTNIYSLSVIDQHLLTRCTASIKTSTVDAAEETAIALAASASRGRDSVTIITDSQQACRNYAKGQIYKAAAAVLRKGTNLPKVTLIWAPGHAGLLGNERAHEVARGLHFRAGERPREENEQEPVERRYSELLAYYRQARQSFPSPNGLTRKQGVIWRQLQTDTFPHIARLHKFYPQKYPSHLCPWCKQLPAKLAHVTWTCPELPILDSTENAEIIPIENNTYEGWLRALSSSLHSDQVRLINRAVLTARKSGVLDMGC